jgi:cold shock CspA family protein
MRGVVARFDDHAGVGTVRVDDGREIFFHCTAIADGSRSITEGTDVEFEVVAGHLGQWEARNLEPRLGAA